jgi:hypothetical protein
VGKKKPSVLYLLFHSFVQEWFEDCENYVKDPRLVDYVNGVSPYWKTCLQRKKKVTLNYSHVICLGHASVLARLT